MEDIVQQIFTDNYREAFEAGATVWLIRQRNPNLGALFQTDQRDCYIQILHRMLHFRREHELEPLNEDIYLAVRPAIEKVTGSPYTTANFNRHISQLTEWKLIVQRLEKERLRGYRDDRRDRFRYRLTDETVAFLYWLEDRLRGGDEETDDAGDLLGFVLARLKELGRELRRLERRDKPAEDISRQAANAVFLLHNINDYTERISRQLSEMSAKMESFLLHSYTVKQAQEVIDSIQSYINAYLSRVYKLRRQILHELDKLTETEHIEQLKACFSIHAAELRKAPRFMRRAVMTESPSAVISRLHGYYCQQGQIDRLCSRANNSAMKVWGKLSAHLRELERKNNRCADIAARLKELSRLPQQMVPHDFFRQLLASGAMVGDPNYWDEFTKAEPPQPRFAAPKTRQTNRSYLPPKSSASAPVVSLDEARLEQLKRWITAKFSSLDRQNGVALDKAEYMRLKDFQRIMELGKRGILGHGKALRKIGFKLEVGDKLTVAANTEYKLAFRETRLQDSKEIADG